MKKKLICLMLGFGLISSCNAMNRAALLDVEEFSFGTDSQKNTSGRHLSIRLNTSDPSEMHDLQKTERVRPRASSVVQNGVIFAGSTALTITSGLCYSSEYPETSLLMTFGWVSITLGTGVKFITSLKRYCW